MTHMSPYSYLDRGGLAVVCLMLYIYANWRKDKFAVFYPSSFRSGKTKPFIVFFIMISLVFLICSDFIAVSFKYDEGWACADGVAKIVHKKNYNADSAVLITPANALWNLAMTTKTSAFFLLNTLWFYVCSRIFKKSPMSSLEFRLSVVYSCLSFCIYFIIQEAFAYNALYSGVFPQIWYNFETFVLLLLNIKSQVAFHKLKNDLPENSQGRLQVEYYMTLNSILAYALFFDCLCGLAPNLSLFIPGPTPKESTINNSVFWMDFITRWFTISHCVEYMCILAIVCPPEIITAKMKAHSRSVTSGIQDSSASTAEAVHSTAPLKKSSV